MVSTEKINVPDLNKMDDIFTTTWRFVKEELCFLFPASNFPEKCS